MCAGWRATPVCLEGCSGLLSLDPWGYQRGPVNILVDDGFRMVDSCPEGAERLDCSGLLAAPCPFDALAAPPREAEWLDELLEEPGVVDASLVEERARLGYCGVLVYGRLGGEPRSHIEVVEAAGVVTPSGRLLGSAGRPLVAAIAVSRRSVYGFRRRTGRFPVEWLAEQGLLEGALVVGSWVASWEARLIAEKGALLAVSPVTQPLLRGGPPPRPAYRGILAVATLSHPLPPWLAAYILAMLYAGVYWGEAPFEEILAGLVRGWRLSGAREPPLTLLDARGFDGTPESLILSRPEPRYVVWPGGVVERLPG